MFKIRTIVGLIAVLLMADISMAAVELTVTPDNGDMVVPGGTISYTATVTMTELMVNLDGEIIPQAEVFSINDYDKQIGWTYVFDPENVILNDGDDIRTSKLTIYVSTEAVPDVYEHTVLALGSDGVITDAEFDSWVISTIVNPVPELSTIILTSAGILGLIGLTRMRRKD